MLRCPYRKMTTSYQEETLETFAECHKDTCPLYVKGKCVRVQKEINVIYFVCNESGKAVDNLKAEPCEVTWVTNNKGEGVAFKNMPIEKVNKILAIMDDDPCEDAVSRADLLNAIYDLDAAFDDNFELDYGRCYKTDLDKMAMALPSVTPIRPKGEWLDIETSYADDGKQYCKCSICGKQSLRPLGDFCRWCGADMRGE